MPQPFPAMAPAWVGVPGLTQPRGGEIRRECPGPLPWRVYFIQMAAKCEELSYPCTLNSWYPWALRSVNLAW